MVFRISDGTDVDVIHAVLQADEFIQPSHQNASNDVHQQAPPGRNGHISRTLPRRHRHGRAALQDGYSVCWRQLRLLATVVPAFGALLHVDT